MNLLERFQTLITGCLAIVAALIAFEGARIQATAAVDAVKAQVDDARRRDREQEEARRFAFAGTVVSSLSTIVRHADEQLPKFDKCPRESVPLVFEDENWSNWSNLSLMSVPEQRDSRELVKEIKSHNASWRHFSLYSRCPLEEAKRWSDELVQIRLLATDLMGATE